MTLPGWVTVKPLLWVIAALLLVVASEFVLLQLAQADTRAAEANRDTAIADLNTRTTERDAFAGRVDDLVAANQAWGRSVETLQLELAKAQRDRQQLDAQAQAAIAAARAEATDADRTLQKFVDQFATESRRPRCAQALAEMEAACPALSNY